jgi:hypothetical protein
MFYLSYEGVHIQFCYAQASRPVGLCSSSSHDNVDYYVRTFLAILNIIDVLDRTKIRYRKIIFLKMR